MAEFLFKTKGNYYLHGKPKVLFTCHPEDFEQSFEWICSDILRTHDCTIYYTKDLNEEIPDSEKETDIGGMNLVVIPVTFRLLTEKNRAMDSDFPYARKMGIPVLPILLESGIDAFYASPERFGQLQYLDPFNNDITAIKYEEKLRKFLDAVLVSDALATRIRAAFDAYIFLSYRKKDRRYANELLKLIHRIPFCRDLAVWYDEFLTPGESFQASIQRILQDSKFLALLVTPQILEENNGIPNYVMGTEYPEAKAMGKEIIPVEMEATDRHQLEAKFAEIPACIQVGDEEALQQQFARSLSNLAVKTQQNDPEHHFLIGLAYLEGIDVEMDRERGLALIIEAAQAGLPEAMKKVYTIYDRGVGVSPDYKIAQSWAEKLFLHYRQQEGPCHPDTMDALDLFAEASGKMGDYQRAAVLAKENYQNRQNVQGANHPMTLYTQEQLALAYGNLGDYRKEAEIEEQVYEARALTQGKEHPDTIRTLGHLAMAYGNYGDYKQSGQMLERVYQRFCDTLGEEHPDTLAALSDLAGSYYRLGDYMKATRLNEQIYAIRKAVLPDNHPDLITAMANLAFTYGKMGHYEKEIELEENVYALRCKVMGQHHPRSLLTLGNLAVAYSKIGNHPKAMELNNLVYAARTQVLGPKHPDTLVTLGNLAELYGKLGDYRRQAELDERLYALRVQVLGEHHPKTILTLGDLAFAYGHLGDLEKAITLERQVYDLRCKILGEEHPETLNTLEVLADFYGQTGAAAQQNDLIKQVYHMRIRVLGETHPDTIRVAP